MLGLLDQQSNRVDKDKGQSSKIISANTNNGANLESSAKREDTLLMLEELNSDESLRRRRREDMSLSFGYDGKRAGKKFT